ncbi:tRNA (adenosine(37)-N6)-threonylcarbamoyltransferase complex ATPase subunit type 1 TsaE [Cognatiyoonia sp. IB215446]|uniref:tRNA (adenosine(37)-N6)-threonylcarbamoyltransferase complex ATPase subunit type 1 TsaE n=1 Tax=Cognatiyoonia sp. IB215446 TaxID=3097355 RepID=UPI002A0C808D|nr:tRNA (adenosine(37)-N6)-threonylcarbamoyltransferase complex ATPase subunit type 1 TsaE [Cognatiyoonia sp. IB215446]MDX8350547.1 tRNA (adenosine(37)-N6)-threonylcarbamoyltransferase complex ATPase subunit type 1 TsaE [Cognatiyoonia sp. IB215446]
MAQTNLHITLSDEAATAALAERIARILKSGDTLLLEGEIGAGKTAFARATIRAMLGRDEDVPSPTFTLVQTYDTPRGPVWHCDLYRLTHPDEVMELGLDEALTDAICLIEWPDRLGADSPTNALHLAFVARAADHAVTLTIPDSWANRMKALDVGA